MCKTGRLNVLNDLQLLFLRIMETFGKGSGRGEALNE